jgi:mRNA interferase MazF
MDDFDSWNEIKKKIDAEPDKPDRFPQEGEVWMCSLGKNIGYEQNGGGESFSRPILVVKKFTNKMFWVVPLSTKQKNLDFYFNYTDAENRKVSAILAQLKLLSVKRLKRKLYELDHENLKEVKKRLYKFLH